MDRELLQWLNAVLPAAPVDLDLYRRALTHPSHGARDYQRLEFLGDRVLGLVMADWLIELFPAEKEGSLSHRFTILVSGRTCADVARAIGVKAYLRLGKQARDDGGYDKDSILGDVTEALLGALYTDHGFEAARHFVRTHWRGFIDVNAQAERHPKSLLHEWAEAHNRKSPAYSIVDRSGPDHAPRFTIRVSLGSAGEAQATGLSKQEAETAAARALLEKLN